MTDRENFLSGFAPLPEEITLPPSFLETYEVESCLSRREGGGSGGWPGALTAPPSC